MHQVRVSSFDDSFFFLSFSPKNFRTQGLVSKETVVFRRWGSVKRKSGMLNELIRVKLPPQKAY